MKLEPTVINPFFIVCVTNISQKTSDQKSVESRTLERGGGGGGGGLLFSVMAYTGRLGI